MPLDTTQIPLRVRVLLDALELLRERGLCQGHAHRGAQMCMFSAIREAGGLVSSGDFDRLGIPWPVPFNDEPGRTFAEVEGWFIEQIGEDFAYLAAAAREAGES